MPIHNRDIHRERLRHLRWAHDNRDKIIWFAYCSGVPSYEITALSGWSRTIVDRIVRKGKKQGWEVKYDSVSRFG